MRVRIYRTIYVYNFLTQEFKGHKSSIHTHLNYLVIVSPPFFPNAATANGATMRNFVATTQLSDRTDVSKVTIFDLENKFVAYSGPFAEGVRAIVSEWGHIYVLTNDGKVSAALPQIKRATISFLLNF